MAEFIKEDFLNLEKLLVYRGILQDSLFEELRDLIIKQYNNSESERVYYQICHRFIKLAEEEGYNGDLWQNYLSKLIVLDKNPFSLQAELAGQVGNSLYKAVQHDIELIKGLYRYTIFDIGAVSGIGETDFMNNYLSSTIENKAVIDLTKVEKLRDIFIKESSQQIIVRLIDYYFSTGTGELGFYKAFRWDESRETLAGILTPDSIKFDELVGYERQKKRLIKNTEAFLNGRKANNVLLFGDSGTGKSSSIKALLNEYAYRGLRLIEITREQGKYLPQILELLKNRGLYFIIFMDDLSFEDFETDYKYLKAVMEGGIEVKPANVLFYATSNRRHIVKEKWADRQEDGEIHISDAVQEKLSLAERFGMTISYQAPDKKQFLDIVKNLAVKQNISMEDDEMKEKALQWEKRYNGFSGRTAQQFINYLDSIN
ncbi:DUF815 domain-containing protein [Iocasia frigidifontis]|uniref:DUF815 domain-containing protein n=1 Tax=Iocasia fonsfrigidae TaxID=2682810 RepID=A0A8A7K5N4_9FIRM|nr:ATP-binding protein [Iocasia fonsfrigidae]QTL97083.1 DUF815 domain-containing protein [Iocasia fonsfrigidae]